MTHRRPRGQLTRSLVAWLERIRRDEHQLALGLSLVIGALVGLVIVAFILLTGRLAARMYPAGVAAWQRALVPTLGSLVAGYLLFRYCPLARGSGIPQTKFALFVADGLITFRTVVGKFVCCSISLAGIALGREGPSVQIGAGLASVIARRLGLGADRVKALIPVGSSAALAAAFNTPITGVLFALEEVVGDLHAPILGAAVLSSATAWMVLHAFLGDEPLFHVAGYQLVHPAELAVYALLGVIGGLGSVAFVKLLLGLRHRFLALGPSGAWLHPLVGGLTVGLLGYFVPEVLGVGYDYIERVLNGDTVLRTLVLLAALKIATAVCYASGNAGGIFGPSLFIGAMLGGAVGAAAHGLFPTYTAEPGAYALVGMGAAFAGIIRTPLTSVIMIFELTRDYTIIVPLMVSNLIALYVSHKLQRVPIYEAIARQDGVHLPTAESRGHAGAARVARAMRRPPEPVTQTAPIGDAAARASAAALEAWPVRDDEGLTGMIATADLQAAVDAGIGGRPLSDLRDVLAGHGRNQPLDHLHADHSLAMALERMGASGHRVLPVVSRANVRRLVGVVTLGDVLAAFGVSDRRNADGDATPSAAVARTGPSVLATAGLVVASLALLTVANAWLASAERTETRADAARLFREGNDLAARGLYDRAIASFRSALNLSRGERDYRLALASALLASDRATDARDAIDNVLRADATDGEANLLMARTLRRLDSAEEAVSFYHRAIHGHWRQGEDEQRVRTRLELADLLARRGSSEELLAELLLYRRPATHVSNGALRSSISPPAHQIVPWRCGAGFGTRTRLMPRRPPASVTPNWRAAMSERHG